MFPRFLFDKPEELPAAEHGGIVDDISKTVDEEVGKKGLAPTQTAASERVGEVLPGYEKRTLTQRLQLWSYQPEDKTTYWQYFKRPFFLFAFPNVVLVCCIQTIVRLKLTQIAGRHHLRIRLHRGHCLVQHKYASPLNCHRARPIY